jgi:hypothetical protein
MVGRRTLATGLAVMGAGLAGLAACVSQPAATVTPAALEAAFAGHSYVGTQADGAAVCIHHAADGTFVGRAGGLVSGTWAIREDRLCYSYARNPDLSACRQVVLAGNRAALLEDGTLLSQGHLAEGNVCA